MSTTKRKKKTPKPEVNYELVRSLFKELMSEMDADGECDNELIEKVHGAEKEFFSGINKVALGEFQKAVAAALRKTPKSARPAFDSQIEFFLWVVATVPGADEKLRLLDTLSWSPCSFRTSLRDHYEDAKYDYYS